MEQGNGSSNVMDLSRIEPCEWSQRICAFPSALFCHAILFAPARSLYTRPMDGNTLKPAPAIRRSPPQWASRLARGRQFAGKRFAFDLQPGKEKEDGHEPVVDPQ